MESLDYWKDIETLERYSFDSEQGKKRIEEMEKYFDKFSKYLGKKILDVGCGAGLFTFWLEEKGFSVTGIDLNEKMLELANQTKQKHNFKSKFYLTDAEKFETNDKFDSIILFGNTIWNFSPQKFVKTIKNLEKLLNENSFILINYRSLLELLATKQWKDPFFDSETIVSFTLNYNDEEAYIEKMYVDLTEKKLPIKERFYVWSKAFLRAIMLALGYKLVDTIETKVDMCTTMDVFQKEK